MPSATITSTASTFGTISGTFVDSDSTISGTISGVITGTLDGSVGVPGPGVPSGGLEGQILLKASDTSYDTVWADNAAETLTATVRNETGATLSKGTVVYITGAAGNKALVSKASASSEATSSKTFAILAEDILNNQNGTAVTVGLLKSLDTSALTEGGSLWLSTTAGQWTQTMPTAPNHAVFLGTVTRVHANQGTVEVRIQNGYELQELHNVKITSVSNGQVLKYDSAQSLWVNGTDSSGVAWGGITGTLSSQTDLQTALDAKLAKAGGVITGDIQSNNGSGYRSYDGAYKQTNVSASMIQLLNSDVGGNTLSIEWNGITFPSGKQTVHYPGTSILSGYATESWVTSGFYPLTGNPSGFLTSASLSGYATESWVTSQGYLTSSALTPYLTSATAASTYQTLAGMSSYLTTSAAASTYYLQTNPAGYITSSALTGYATQAWVDAQGYLQAGALTGYALESWVTSQGYLTDAPSDGNQYARKNGAWDVVSAGTSYITSVTAPLSVTGSDLSIDLSAYETTANAAATYYPLSNPSGYITSSALTPYLLSSTAASTYQTISGMSSYAPLASPALTGNVTITTNSTSPALVIVQDGTGDVIQFKDVTSDTTYSFIDQNGKVGTVASTTTNAGFNVPHGTAPTTPVNGDIWTTTGDLLVRLNGSTRTMVNVEGTQTISGTKTFSASSITLGNSTAAGTIALGTGATASGSTKTVNIGTSGAAGSTTNIAIGSTTGTSTTTLQGITNGVTQSAGDSSLKLATTAFVTTADNLKANLASPALTGTPTAPTATAGTNTTQIATTAFVTAAVPAAATHTQAVQFASSTTYAKVIDAASQRIAPSAHRIWPSPSNYNGTATVGTGASTTLTITGYTLLSPSAGVAGSASAYHGGTASELNYALWGDSSGSTINFSKRVSMSFRFAQYPSDVNSVSRVVLGKIHGTAVGDLTSKGIGVKYTQVGAGYWFYLQVHNGTTLANVQSSTQYAGGVADLEVVSDGAGNATLYLNGVSVATSTGAPTGSTASNATVYAEVDSAATTTVQPRCSIGRLFVNSLNF